MNNVSSLPHESGYSFSIQDLKRSILSGCSRIVYAARYLNLARLDEQCTEETNWTHRTVALIKAIPLLGALVALCEPVAMNCFLYLKNKNISIPNKIIPYIILNYKN